ncbi:quinon protein alcohol dehydrogenase-like superfamily [Ganoderma leucocontextum]|nr:quinon protein alcohol dehydrogenase-like superfamily [Ganoderma leucocontextum]
MIGWLSCCEKYSNTHLRSWTSVMNPVLRTLLLKSSPSEWVHLGSFTWHVPLEFKSEAFTSSVHHFITALQDFRRPTLREVTVDIHFGSFQDLVATLLPSVSSELRAELETTLLPFPQPTLSFSPKTPLAFGRNRFWKKELIPFFPMLATRHALTINARSSGKAGHDGAISTAIVISADSIWAATGSEDGTIIIWDTENECITQEWHAHPARSGVGSLSLSADSRYILSAASFGRSIVWDLHQDPRGATSLADHEDLNRKPLKHCVWSAEGSWIVSGSHEESHSTAVHLWDAHTFKFQRLHPRETCKGGTLLAFSPDGCWIVTRENSDPNLKSVARIYCRVWNVKSGKLHRTLWGHVGCINAAAFNPGSTRIVTGSEDGTIRIWDVETGKAILILKDQGASGIPFVVYSPDRKLVLSSSLVTVGRRSKGHYGGVKIWDASTGALLACLTRNSDYFRVIPYPACFSPCGRYVASASDEQGEVRLWRTSDCSYIARASGGRRSARVTQVAISPDGRVLCCGAEDGTVFFRRMFDLIPA